MIFHVLSLHAIDGLFLGETGLLMFSTERNLIYSLIDPFTERHKLVHNGGFSKSEALYCSQNAVKSIKVL